MSIRTRTSIRPPIRSTSTFRAMASSTRRWQRRIVKRHAGARGLRQERRGRIALAVGRVDLSDLPAFSPRREIDLLRAYLDKDHRFRRGELTGERFAVVDEHFPIRTDAKPGREGPPESKSVAAYSVAAALFGSAAVKRAGWFELLRTRTALFAFASGPGLQTSCEEVGTTTDLAQKDPKVIFSVVWGSFFGDWEHRDNFLRAQLATSAGLMTAWGSDPWLLHPLALGATAGECALLTQESSPLTHLALMGDPSLRMFIVAPPTGLVATPAAAKRGLPAMESVGRAGARLSRLPVG